MSSFLGEIAHICECMGCSRYHTGCDADSLMQNSRFLRYLYVKGKDAICIRRSPYNYGRPLL